MRNIVEHGQTSGSSDTTVLSGVSASSRLTRWISVPTAIVEPAGRRVDGLDDVVGGADLVGELAHLVAALGVGDDDAVGVLGPEGGSTCSGRNRWWTEQWPFHSRNVASLKSASVRPPRSRRGFHTRMSSWP